MCTTVAVALTVTSGEVSGTESGLMDGEQEKLGKQCVVVHVYFQLSQYSNSMYNATEPDVHVHVHT